MYHNLEFHVPRRFNTGEKSFFVVVVVVVVFSSFNSSGFLGFFLFWFFFSSLPCRIDLPVCLFPSVSEVQVQPYNTQTALCMVTTPVDIQKSAVGKHSYSCRVAHS